MYDTFVLKQLQNIELQMFKEFDRICRKYKIVYFLCFGSAIGCVRHHGMIPWDDDIDIGMVYEEYCKLREIPKDEWNNSILLCDPMDNNESHLYPYPRIYKTDTHFIPTYSTRLKSRRLNNCGFSCDGIWIDIFVYHRTSSPKKAIKIDKKVMSLRKKYLYSKKRQIIGLDKSIKRNFVSIIENIYHFLVNIIYRTPETRILRKYNALFENDGDYVVTYDARPCGPAKTIILYDDIFPVIDREFEGIKAMLPRGYDLMLKKIYGDYMRIPQEDERVIHTPAILDFGRGNVIK